MTKICSCGKVMENGDTVYKIDFGMAVIDDEYHCSKNCLSNIYDETQIAEMMETGECNLTKL